MVMAPGSHGSMVLALLLHALLLSTSNAYSTKSVTVNLRARWQGTSFTLEAAEFLATESPVLYWNFVERYASAPPSSTDGDCWSAVSSAAASELSPGLSRVLQLSMASRQHSAKLQMYHQLALDYYQGEASCCWVDVGGTVVTDPSALHQVLAGATNDSTPRASKRVTSQQVYDFDHVWLKAPLQGQPVILYGAPGTACFGAFHEVLSSSKVAEQGLRYVHRPVLMSNCQLPETSCLLHGAEEQLVLPGYGVELQLKNTEYSAMDDKEPTGGAGAGGGSTSSSSDEDSLGEVQGFLFDTLVERKPRLKQELLTFRDHLLSSDEEESVKVWDLKDVGLQAAQRISNASDPLALLSEISQNFPSIVSSLSRGKIDRKLRQSVEQNQEMLSSGSNYMIINGMALDIKNFDFYACLERLQLEVKLMDQLARLGLGPVDQKKLLYARAEDKTDKMEEVRLNLHPVDQVTFLNDLEKDDMYLRFSGSITDILHTFPGRLRPLAVNAFTAVFVVNPVAPGGAELAQLLFNMWQGTYPIRFGLALAIPSVTERARLRRRGAPGGSDFPSWEEMSVGEQFGRAFFMLKGVFGGPAAWQLWHKFTSEFEYDEPTTDHVESAFKAAWKEAGRSAKGQRAKVAAKKTPADALKQLMTGTNLAAEVGTQLLEHSEYLLAKGLSNLEGPHAVLNGILVPLSGQPDRQLLQRVMMEMQVIQEAVYYGKITDEDESVLDSLLELQGSVGRYNPRILAVSGEEGGEGEGATSGGSGSGGKQHQVDLSVVLSQVPTLAQRLAYLHQKGTSSSVKPVSHWVVADVSTPEGLGLLRDTVTWLHQSTAAKQARLAWIPNRSSGREERPSPLEVVLQLLIEQGEEGVQVLLSKGDLAAKLAARPSTAAEAQELVGSALGVLTSAGVDVTSIKTKATTEVAQSYGEDYKESWPYTEAVSACRLLGIAPGAAGVVTNGRVLLSHDPTAPPSAVQEVDAEDLGLLQLLATKYQPATHVTKLISNALTKGRLTGPDGEELSVEEASSIAMVVLSAFGAAKYPGTDMPTAASRNLQNFMGQLSGEAVQVGAKDGGLEIVAILNPLTRTAQRLSAVLSWLKTALNPSIALFLNPERDMSKLPLKSFYRFALPELEEGPDGLLQLVGPPQGYFSRLPQKRVLTLGLEVPEAWLVEPTHSVYDMDNLRLVDAKERVVTADFELEALMLTGSCFDTTGGRERPPRGLQLHLGAHGKAHISDTLVMANLGYFQLQGAPGLFTLTLAPGRSRQIYYLTSSTGTQDQDSDPGQEAANTLSDITTQVIIYKFTGKHMYLRVQKRPGMEDEELLGKPEVDEEMVQEEDDEYADEEEESTKDKPKSGGLWGSITSLFGGKNEGAPGNDVINVFTIASGHMYERLQKIMMLSVIKNTKSRVKFWLIKNYMSPHHKRVIPEMAKHYGFDVAFVTYKWPQWLHKQTDKQRMIWAYKILFLDVLFPLNTPRIIFVDSDQVVRADLRELYDMDLKGAPYAYTPFCDNNKEMDEFRFWKGGFWKDHLQGKPYHISALYLVDLKRFRQLAAGDQLRVVYDMLSKDPNSLANLDQDLPNYAQHNIPIFSLPQEWLWCESWCGNSTKGKAKTIDLCNNPRTKEPKLSAARRIVTEWPQLDEEVANFTAITEAKLADGGEEADGERVGTVDAESAVIVEEVDGGDGTGEGESIQGDESASSHGGCDSEMCSLGLDDDEPEGHDNSEL